jgi:hypothetical protein
MRFASIPQSDFGGAGIDEPFDVREGVRVRQAKLARSSRWNG